MHKRFVCKFSYYFNVSIYYHFYELSAMISLYITSYIYYINMECWAVIFKSWYIKQAGIQMHTHQNNDMNIKCQISYVLFPFMHQMI